MLIISSSLTAHPMIKSKEMLLYKHFPVSNQKLHIVSTASLSSSSLLFLSVLFRKRYEKMPAVGGISVGGGKAYPGSLTPFVTVTCIVAAMGGLIFGYDIGISGTNNSHVCTYCVTRLLWLIIYACVSVCNVVCFNVWDCDQVGSRPWIRFCSSFSRRCTGRRTRTTRRTSTVNTTARHSPCSPRRCTWRRCCRRWLPPPSRGGSAGNSPCFSEACFSLSVLS